jgi:hypothetical protein
MRPGGDEARGASHRSRNRSVRTVEPVALGGSASELEEGTELLLDFDKIALAAAQSPGIGNSWARTDQPW